MAPPTEPSTESPPAELSPASPDPLLFRVNSSKRQPKSRSSLSSNPLFGPGSKKSNLANDSTNQDMQNTDESSDDDDSQAIADALLGRTLNSGLLLGRMQSHKEDGELSEEERRQELSNKSSLLARMGRDDKGKSASYVSLLDRLPPPTSPRGHHLQPQADRRVNHSRNIGNHSSHTHQIIQPIDKHHQDSKLTGLSSAATSPQASSQAHPISSSAKRISLFAPANGSSSKDRHDSPNSDSIDGLISSIMHKGDAPNQEKSYQPKTIHDSRFNQSPPSLSHRLDHPTPVTLEDRQAHSQSGLLARIGEQSTANNKRSSPLFSAAESGSIPTAPAAFGLRDRLALPSATSLSSNAVSTSKSLLERTIPKAAHLPALQLVHRSPDPVSIPDLRPLSTRHPEYNKSTNLERGVSPRSSSDRRRTSHVATNHYAPKRRHRSRSRSPTIGGRRGLAPYSPTPLSGGSRGRSPPSPRQYRYPRSRYSRSPPPFERERRRSPPRAPRGYRRPSSPARSTGWRRRDSQISPGSHQSAMPHSARDRERERDQQHEHRRATPSLSVPPPPPPPPRQADSIQTDKHAPHRLTLREASTPPSPQNVSILISNFPSNLDLKPSDVYTYLVNQSSSFDTHDDESCRNGMIKDDAPFELTLYRFAGTERVCGELRFRSEESARIFEKRARREWMEAWGSGGGDDGSGVKDEQRRLEFVIVDRERTPWPRQRSTYKHDPENPNPETAQTLLSALSQGTSTMQISAGPSVPTPDPLPVNSAHPLKELGLGPPTPTSFNSHPICPPSPIAEQQTSVLLSGLRPSTNISVLHSLFVVPTRPRQFRIFEPNHIKFGVLDSGRACVLRFEDGNTAKHFCRVVLENAPFQSMQASLVDLESIEFLKTDFSSSIPLLAPPRSQPPTPPKQPNLQPIPVPTNLPPRPTFSAPPHSPISMEIDRIVQQAQYEDFVTSQQQAFYPFLTRSPPIVPPRSLQPLNVNGGGESRAQELRQALLARRSRGGPGLPSQQSSFDSLMGSQAAAGDGTGAYGGLDEFDYHLTGGCGEYRHAGGGGEYLRQVTAPGEYHQATNSHDYEAGVEHHHQFSGGEYHQVTSGDYHPPDNGGRCHHINNGGDYQAAATAAVALGNYTPPVNYQLGEFIGNAGCE